VLAALEVTSAPQNLGGGISTGGVTLVHDLSKSLISGSTSGWRSRDRASPSRSSSSSSLSRRKMCCRTGKAVAARPAVAAGCATRCGPASRCTAATARMAGSSS
jgi:hypothetical protein